MGNSVNHSKGHLDSADLVKVPEMLVRYFIFGMFLLLHPLPQIFHCILSR